MRPRSVGAVGAVVDTELACQICQECKWNAPMLPSRLEQGQCANHVKTKLVARELRVEYTDDLIAYIPWAFLFSSSDTTG